MGIAYVEFIVFFGKYLFKFWDTIIYWRLGMWITEW